MSHFHFLAHYFTTIFVPQVEAFADSLVHRVLPGFATIGAEGERLEQEAYHELLARPGGEDFDVATAADDARDQAIAYWVAMYGIQQGVVNLFGVGLWHLFEQQLVHFIRHGLRDIRDRPPEQPLLETVQAELLRMGIDIDIASLAAHAKVDELRLFANCAKHGDGPACSQLRAQRPDLFTPPSRHASEGTRSGAPVIAPLGGEDLYLTLEGFQQYASAVIGFWKELAGKILEVIAR